MKKILRRKAISPIIATVLLILIAIATGVIIYAFATGWIGSRTSNSGPSSLISIDAASIKLKSGTTYSVTVYVRNLGSVPVNLSGIYLLNASGEMLGGNTTTSQWSTSPSSTWTVGPGHVLKVSCSITASASLKHGYSYVIKVTTNSGSYVTTSILYR